ncbi:hypothetical protein [Ottowia oryzae]
MPFASPSEKVEDKKAVYLLMVTLENSYRPSFHPRLQTVVVDRRVGDKWEGNLISADLHGIVVVPGAAVNSYAARLELEPGEYVLRRLNANGMVFPIQGTFEVPLYANLSVREPTGVFYLGNVRATVREAKDGELKAGPVIPLIDQAVAGASGGTFEVTITDAWRTDEAVFPKPVPSPGQSARAQGDSSCLEPRQSEAGDREVERPQDAPRVRRRTWGRLRGRRVFTVLVRVRLGRWYRPGGRHIRAGVFVAVSVLGAVDRAQRPGVSHPGPVECRARAAIGQCGTRKVELANTSLVPLSVPRTSKRRGTVCPRRACAPS